MEKLREKLKEIKTKFINKSKSFIFGEKHSLSRIHGFCRKIVKTLVLNC